MGTFSMPYVLMHVTEVNEEKKFRLVTENHVSFGAAKIIIFIRVRAFINMMS